MAEKPYKPTLYDAYQNKRSWYIDTAETPEQKKALPGELKRLQEQYLKQKAAQARTQAGVNRGTPGAINVNPLYQNNK
jgi:hypothetical protein